MVTGIYIVVCMSEANVYISKIVIS